MKLVINRCYGGFGISHEAIIRYWEIKGEPIWYHEGKYRDMVYTTSPVDPEDEEKVDELYWYYNDLERDDPILVQVVEELGEKACDVYSKLEVVEIPDDIDWYIDEYDGRESIHENHRSW